MHNSYAPERCFRFYKSKQTALLKIYLNQETRFWMGKHLFPESHAVHLCFKLDLLARWLKHLEWFLSSRVIGRNHASTTRGPEAPPSICGSFWLGEAVIYAKLRHQWGKWFLPLTGQAVHSPSIVHLQHPRRGSVWITQPFSTNYAVLVTGFFLSSLFEGLHSATEAEQYMRQRTPVLVKDTTDTLEKVKCFTILLFLTASN